MTRSVAAEKYCLQRSWLLRRRSEDSRWLIGLAVEHLPDRLPQDRVDELRAGLQVRLGESVRDRYSNPVVVWVLLNLVVPIVVKFVLEWWLNRKD